MHGTEKFYLFNAWVADDAFVYGGLSHGYGDGVTGPVQNRLRIDCFEAQKYCLRLLAS